MKKILISTLVFFSGSIAYSGEYFQANAGHNNYGFQLGSQNGSLDVSIGYQVIKGDVDLHVIAPESYYVHRFNDKLRGKLGIGLGLGIPDAPNGGDKYDTGLSWVIGGGTEYFITPSVSLVGSLKGIFMESDVRVTTYGSHSETLSNGQSVEVLDVYHEYARRSLNRVAAGVGIRVYF